MALQKPTFSHNYLTTKPTQMKKSYRSGNHCFGNPVANTEQKLTRHNSFISLTLVLLLGIAIMSCQKPGSDLSPNADSQAVNVVTSESEVLNNYSGLSWQTQWQLQQARAATARYRNINNAFADEYVDINVIVPEMGYHYLKLSGLDLEFDPKKPEILVYNREHDGSMKLVAVEYAVPINLSPNNAPAGFAGNDDVWDKNTGFGLWLLHAWVWKFNPEGVFNATNPSVHLH